MPSSTVHCCIVFVLERLPGLECFRPRSSSSRGFALLCICLKPVFVPPYSNTVAFSFLGPVVILRQRSFQEAYLMLRSYTYLTLSYGLGTRSGQSNPTRSTSSAVANVARVHITAVSRPTTNTDPVPLASSAKVSISRLDSCSAALLRC